ncbi:MAG TPA: hypothetical protein VGI24_02970 [Solirubrobacteraceae bacterium]
MNAVLVTAILPNVFSLLAGLRELFAGCAGTGVVFVFAVLVVELEVFEAGGLAAVEVVAGVVDPVDPVDAVGPVDAVAPVEPAAVFAVVVVEATLAEPPLEPSPQPAIATIAPRHATIAAGAISGLAPRLPDRSCPPNLRPMSRPPARDHLIFRRSALYKSSGGLAPFTYA